MDQELKKARNIGQDNLADYAREGLSIPFTLGLVMVPLGLCGMETDYGASDGEQDGPQAKKRKKEKAPPGK